MAEASERLSLLEQQVHRAVELIEALRAENARLDQERTGLAARVEALTLEVTPLRAKEQALTRLETEHRRLLAERLQLLGQVDGILKELARVDGV